MGKVCVVRSSRRYTRNVRRPLTRRLAKVRGQKLDVISQLEGNRPEAYLSVYRGVYPNDGEDEGTASRIYVYMV